MKTEILNRLTPLPMNSRVILKNRVVVPPMASSTATIEGEATLETQRHYERLARSGTGLVFVEYTYVHTSGRSEKNQLGIWTDEHVTGLAPIAAAIHKEGAFAGLQLVHSGGKSSRDLTAGALMGPSSISVPSRDETLEDPVPMSAADIDLWKKSFGEGARRAKTAGFDLVEIHSAHGYGLNQWLSPLTNQRTDFYGGSLFNRARLLLEIVEQIKHDDPDLLVAVRIPGQDLLPGGLSVDDMIQVSRWLVEKGVDLLDISSGLGGWRRPRDRTGEGYLVSEAEIIQANVAVPVIGVGGIQSLGYLDAIIGTGAISLAAVGRAILSDPEGFKKTMDL